MLRLERSDGGGAVNFPIDHERSCIEGIIDADEPDAIHWRIEIECQEVPIPRRPGEWDEDEPDHPGYPDDCSLELSGLTFPLSEWRELADKVSEVAFEADEVHPILPDNPGNFYFDSCHHVPDENQVRFGERRGVRFALEWRCVARASANETGERVEVRTHLAFRQFQVHFREPGAGDLESARRLVRRFARAEDIRAPVERTPNWVLVPVRPAAA